MGDSQPTLGTGLAKPNASSQEQETLQSASAADRKRRSISTANVEDTNRKKGKPSGSTSSSPSRQMDTEEADISDADMAKHFERRLPKNAAHRTGQNGSPPDQQKNPRRRATPAGWPTTRPLVPIITVERPSDDKKLQDLITAVNTGRSHRVVATCHATNVTLQCYDTDDFNSVKAVLADLQAGFHSYTHRKARQVRLVLENAPPYYSTEELKAFLGTQGLQVDHIVRFTHRDGTPSDNLLVGFAHGTLLEDVKAVQYVDYCRITWRPFRNSKDRVLQCKNCFRYNHVARNCNHPTVCSVCGRNHPSNTQCNPEPHCVQCKADGHLPGTAACPRHQEALARRTARSTKPTPRRQPRSASRVPPADTAAFPGLPRRPQPRQPVTSPSEGQRARQTGRAPRQRSRQGCMDFSQLFTEHPTTEDLPCTAALNSPKSVHQVRTSQASRQPEVPPPNPSKSPSPPTPPPPPGAQPPGRTNHVVTASPEPKDSVSLTSSHQKLMVRSVVETVNNNPDMLHPTVTPAVFLENTTIVLAALLQEKDRAELTKLVSRYMMVMFFFGYGSTP